MFFCCVVGMGILCNPWDLTGWLAEYGNMFIRMQLNTVILYYLIQKIQEGFMKIVNFKAFGVVDLDGLGPSLISLDMRPRTTAKNDLGSFSVAFNFQLLENYGP